jgi:hypothetical protein
MRGRREEGEGEGGGGGVLHPLGVLRWGMRNISSPIVHLVPKIKLDCLRKPWQELFGLPPSGRLKT